MWAGFAILGSGDEDESGENRDVDREARKQKNMTQKDLAAALHVSDRAVSKWERGGSLR